MVGFRRVDWQTCTDPLVSRSVLLLAWCRDCTRSRGLHRRSWRPRCRSRRCGGHACLWWSRRGDRWSRRSALGRRTAPGPVRADGSLCSGRLSGWRLRTTNLGCARLSAWRLRTTNLSGARLSGWRLRTTNLSCATLSGWRLRTTNLCSARLTGWRLRTTNLCSARLTGWRLRTTNLCSARLTGWRLRTTNLSGRCGCQTCSRGSAGTGWGAMLCLRLRPRLSSGRRARLRWLASLLPRQRGRTCRGSGCVRPTRCGWRRLRGSHLRLLYRRSRLAALRPLGLSSKPEPGQKALFGPWSRRRIPYGYGTLSRPCTGRR
jgi:Pentapeptide repeats (8 copies)